MDINISGAGVINSGEYDEIRVSGSARLEGPVRCGSFACSGAVRGDAALTCGGSARVSGSAKLNGAVKAAALYVSGAFSCEGAEIANECQLSGSAGVGGRLVGGDIEAFGVLRVEDQIEANAFHLSGTLECGGLLNAETVLIRLGKENSAVQAIGGTSVTVSPHPGHSLRRRFRFFFCRKKRGLLTVRESVEADDVSLENTLCPEVTGARVKIGAGCEIGLVRYSESCEIHPDAVVRRQEKTYV